ncbi:hypothetical protein QTP70_019248, partial [Hemibagrus guttatus]
MNTYICESLTVGIIHPSLSPAGAGFFFVEKKDKPLRPCINYRGLNAINAKNCYPLPLTSSAFELLQGATVFTKLDLQNAYHLVRIREDMLNRFVFVFPDDTLIISCSREKHVRHVRSMLQRLLQNRLYMKAEK